MSVLSGLRIMYSQSHRHHIPKGHVSFMVNQKGHNTCIGRWTPVDSLWQIEIQIEKMGHFAWNVTSFSAKYLPKMRKRKRKKGTSWWWWTRIMKQNNLFEFNSKVIIHKSEVVAFSGCRWRWSGGSSGGWVSWGCAFAVYTVYMWGHSIGTRYMDPPFGLVVCVAAQTHKKLVVCTVLAVVKPLGSPSCI